jgi:hypothetical protein
MGNSFIIFDVFSDCFKKKDIEKPILTITGIYTDDNKLLRLSDLIENNTVRWAKNHEEMSEIHYYDMINETRRLRKKYRNDIA